MRIGSRRTSARVSIVLALVAGGAAAAPGCGPKKGRAAPADEPHGAAATFVEGWRAWEKINAAPFASKGHGSGMFVVNLHANRTGAAAVRAKKGPYPVGTVLVKEHFVNRDGAAGDPGPLMSMEKRPPGYDPENGDWEYVKAKPDGSVESRGADAMCIGCHSTASASNPDADHVFGAP